MAKIAKLNLTVANQPTNRQRLNLFHEKKQSLKQIIEALV